MRLIYWLRRKLLLPRLEKARKELLVDDINMDGLQRIALSQTRRTTFTSGFEERYARSWVYRAAAAKELALSGFWSDELAEEYNPLGIQQYATDNPVAASVDYAGNINVGNLLNWARDMTSRDFRPISQDFLDMALEIDHPFHGYALEFLRALSPEVTINAVDRDRRDTLTERKSERLYKICLEGLLSKHGRLGEQLQTEHAVINTYESGAVSVYR